MRKKISLNEELNRIKGLMVYQNGEYNNPLIVEQKETLPSINKKVEFAPGFYRLKGTYNRGGTSWNWDVEKTLNPELQKIKNFLTNNPEGFVVNVTLAAGESQIPNVDREVKPVKYVDPGHLSKNRMNTIKTYIAKVFKSWLDEGVIKDEIKFNIKPPKIGDTKWVGQSFCPESERAEKDDPQGYKCGKAYRSSPNYKTLKDKYTSEQFLNVSISVDKIEPDPGGGDSMKVTENCASGVEIVVETPTHECNNAEFFIFANKTLLMNIDGGNTHNGSNSDGNTKLNKFELDTRALNPGYGKLGTLKYGLDGDIRGRRFDKFIITPEQSKKIVAQSTDGTMKIWAVCVKGKCHSDLVSVTINHPSKQKTVFGPQKVKSNNSVLVILSPCGDTTLSKSDVTSLDKDAPDVAGHRNTWFNERKKLTLDLNKGVEPKGNLDFKSTQLYRTDGLSNLVDEYLDNVKRLFETIQKQKMPENARRDFFAENFGELRGDMLSDYRDFLKGFSDSDPSFIMKKGKQLSLSDGSYSFENKWVRKDELSGDIRDDMFRIFKVLDQVFSPVSFVIGNLKHKGGTTKMAKKLYLGFKEGKTLKRVKDIQKAKGMVDKSISIKN